LLIQKEDGTFAPTEEKSGVENPHYAITSLVSDFNQDGYLDMIWTNIDTPSLAYINKGGNNNYLQVNLGKSANTIGAKVTVTTPSKTLTDWLITGEGLASDQTGLLQFGLGQEKTVTNVTVQLADGHKITMDNLKINSVINMKSKIQEYSIEKQTISEYLKEKE
jgi:hypothetical protein